MRRRRFSSSSQHVASTQNQQPRLSDDRPHTWIIPIRKSKCFWVINKHLHAAAAAVGSYPLIAQKSLVIIQNMLTDTCVHYIGLLSSYNELYCIWTQSRYAEEFNGWIELHIITVSVTKVIISAEVSSYKWDLAFSTGFEVFFLKQHDI